jgi:hypothetical protein
MSEMSDPEPREAKNTLFSVLGNHRRRYVLYACNQAEGETTLGDVAEQVAAWEYGKSPPAVTSTERKRIYTSIQQHHLSKLEEAGLVQVDGDRIRTTEKAEDLDVYLDIVPGQNIPWATYYLGLAVVGGLAIVFLLAGWLPAAATPSVLLGAFVLLVGASATAHLIESRRTRFSTVDRPPEVEWEGPSS